VLTALDHVLVAVRDLPGATRTFGSLLGRSPSWRGEHPGLGTQNALFRLDNTYLELLCPTFDMGFGGLLRARLEREGEGLLGLAFRTDDIQAFHAGLRAKGLEAGAPEEGLGRDVESGAMRRWRSVLLPGAVSGDLLLLVVEHLDPEATLPPALASAPPASCVSSVDHVVVASSDLDASQRLYGGTLGLRLALDRRFEARGLRILFFRVGGATVEVVGSLGVPAPGAAPDRLAGLALQVPDADEARARVSAGGFDVSSVRAGFKPGTRVCTVRGRPLGVDTLLIEPAPRRTEAVR
jgi:catechol 2,3-dioxygenase-like lactoylglutathione lyase family enzyme